MGWISVNKRTDSRTEQYKFDSSERDGTGPVTYCNLPFSPHSIRQLISIVSILLFLLFLQLVAVQVLIPNAVYGLRSITTGNYDRNMVNGYEHDVRFAFENSFARFFLRFNLQMFFKWENFSPHLTMKSQTSF